LADNLVDALDGLSRSAEDPDFVCFEVGLAQKFLHEVADRTHAGMARLHVLQMHSERERWGIDRAQIHQVVFHSDLGTDRVEIVPALARWLGLRRYLEVGVLGGDCAAALLAAIPAAEVHLVDPFEAADAAYFESLRQLEEYSPEALAARGEKVRERFRGEPNVTLWQMTSREASNQLGVDGPFDLVFIDGDHSYREVSFDLRAWTAKVRLGGLVVVHDYSGDCPHGEYEVVRAVHDFLPWGATVHTSLDTLAWFQA